MLRQRVFVGTQAYKVCHGSGAGVSGLQPSLPLEERNADCDCACRHPGPGTGVAGCLEPYRYCTVAVRLAAAAASWLAACCPCFPYACSPAEHHESVAEHLSGEHDSQFDHQAFLGKSESDKFDQLSPEEAGRRLG